MRRACRYFVAAGAISAVCSAAALYLCAVRSAAAATIGSLPLVPLLDAAAQGLLFSAAGAAFAARGVVGTAAGPWGGGGGDAGGGGGGGSVCDAAGAFCGKVSVAAGVGACAAVAVAVAAMARDARRRGSSEGPCDW